MVKVLLFDLDGVVNKSDYFLNSLTKEYCVTLNEIMDFIYGDFSACLRGQEDVTKVLPKYLKKWGWKEGVRAFLVSWFAYENNLDDEMIHLVKTLSQQGIVCCLASDQEKYKAEHLRENTLLNSVFTHLFFSCELGATKCDPLYFKKVLEKLQKDLPLIQKEEILFIDDAAKNVAVAQRAGLQGHVFTSREDLKKLNL